MPRDYVMGDIVDLLFYSGGRFFICSVSNKLCRNAYGDFRGSFCAYGEAYGGVHAGDVRIAYSGFRKALVCKSYLAAAAYYAHIACGSAQSLLQQLIVSLMAPGHNDDIIIRSNIYAGGHFAVWGCDYIPDSREEGGV